MTIRQIFKSHLPSVNYFFKNGMQGAFLLGRYETDNEKQIEELNAEVSNGHPHIYIDPAEKEIDTEAPTPLELIRAEAYAQAKADLIASGLMSDKTSTSDSGAFKDSITNTTDIAEAAAGSDGGTTTAMTGTAPVTVNPSLMASLAAFKKA